MIRLAMLESQVTSIEERIAKLSGRCTHGAWINLQRMRHHPNFPGLLSHLEMLEGAVTQDDVEEAAMRFVDECRE